MGRTSRLLAIALALFVSVPAWAAPAPASAETAPEPAPSSSGAVHTPPPADYAALLDRTRNEALARFAEEDARAKPAPGGIVFVGSSIFALWPDVPGDMAPLPAFNRAIGGTTSAIQLDAIERLALAYQPSIIVFYAGSNDIGFGAPADRVVGNVLRYAALVHERLPRAQFVFTSINRAPQRRDKWAVADEANARIRAEAERNPAWFTYVDVNRALQDDKGEPLPGLYGPDQLHFVPSAYARFTAVIRPVLERLAKP